LQFIIEHSSFINLLRVLRVSVVRFLTTIDADIKEGEL